MIKEDDHNEVKTEDKTEVKTEDKTEVKTEDKTEVKTVTDTDKKDVPSAIKEMEESKGASCTDENKDATLAKIDIKVPDTKDEADNPIQDQ